MQRALIVIALLALARDSHADARVQQLATGYEREVRNCKIQRDGVAKALEGATSLQEDVHEEALAADIKQLEEARDAAQAYCDELATTIELLRADQSATYKSLEKQIAEHDNKIRVLRKASKTLVDGVASIIQRVIPRVNKRAGTTRPPPKPPEPPPPPAPPPPPPAPPPPPRPAITEGPTTSLSVHSFTGGTCEDQAKRLAHKDDHDIWDRAAPKQRVPGGLAWLPGAKWKVSYVAADRFVQIECVQTKTGGFLLSLDEADKTRPDRELLDLAARSLAR